MRIFIILYLLLYFSSTSCSQENRNVLFFKGTEVYELAKAVEEENLNRLEKLVTTNPNLLNINDETSGSNVLSLSLSLENFEAFKKLLQLGADPNFINPYSKRSILIEASKFYWKPEAYTIDLRYIDLLLQYGANPNYVVEENVTDEKGRSYMATSSLMEASRLDLGMVKLLIKAGADPYKKLKQNQESPFSKSLSGNKFDIANYFIDSFNIDVKEPLSVVVQKPSNEIIKFYIQDYLVNKFLKAKIMGDIDKMKMLENENPKISEVNREAWRFIEKLESMGVDFKNYKYKR